MGSPAPRTDLVTAVVAGLLAGAHAASRRRTGRVAHRIARLDPRADAREVVQLLGMREFGLDTELALSFALFRTYAVPSISVLLEATGAFTADARKRYDDTELVLAEMGKHGLEHDRGRTALKRMNTMHAAFDIDPDDTLYTLTTFVCEPERWIQRFGWRPTTPAERQAAVHWYRELGHHMGLRDLPTAYDWYEEFNLQYEAEHFRHHPANRAVADASVEVFLDEYLPRPLHGSGRVAIRAMMDDPLREALGYEPAPTAVVRAVEGALHSRAWVQRNLLPERRSDFDLTTRTRPSYPHGYEVDQLGTFPTTEQRAEANDAVAAHRATTDR